MYIKKSLKKLIAASMIAGGMTLTLTPMIDGSNIDFTVMSVAHAEVKTYTGVGEYIMSDFETPEVAKQRAKARAEQNAQEQAGVYVSGFTQVNNMQVTEDEVIVITSGIMSVTDVSYEKRFGQDDTTIFTATIKANIDTDDVNKWLEKGIQERSAIAAQNKELQEALEEQNKQIAELKRLLAEKDPNTDVNKIKAEFVDMDKAFMSNQKVESGNRAYFNDDYQRAISEYSQAIELNPNNAIAYRNRGTSYANLQSYSRAAKDFSKVIELEPNNASGYIGRGAAYIYMMKYNSAISDLTDAIELNPNDPLSYYNRGICYQAIGNMERAQSDYSKARALGYND